MRPLDSAWRADLKTWWRLGLGACWALAAGAQTVPVVNPSFEAGAARPDGWTLSGGTGEWLTEGAEGRRAVAVSGSGQDTNYWRTAGLPLAPNTLYYLRYRARSQGAAGGTAVTGLVFSNRDLGVPPPSWTRYTQTLVTPRAVNPDSCWLRFGQWHVFGTVAFDDVELVAAEPVHAGAGDLVLGQGEQVRGHHYAFTAPLSTSGSYCRPLASHQCGFNSNRWVFGAEADLIYRHQLGDRRQSAAAVTVNVGWYAGGLLAVSASADGQTWRELGTQEGLGTKRLELPADLLPAREVWIKLQARAKAKLGTDSDPGSFQLYGYHYEATLDGPAVELTGETRFVAVPVTDPGLRVRFESLGDALPGGRNQITARVDNTGDRPRSLRPVVTLAPGGPTGAAAPVVLPPGEQRLSLPYQLPGSGDYELTVVLGGDSPYLARMPLYVADLYRADYGRRLPGSSDEVGLWACESGWKVSDVRPVPTAGGEAVEIDTARNEAEAAQLVIRPAKPLRTLTLTAGSLAGPRGAAIAAERIELLRVRYVTVEQPTDRTGVAAPWPDPLPPLTAPLDLPAGRNQPVWVRVTPPRGIPAGRYRGTIALAADGWRASVPLQVTVRDFDLPDRMTLTTAFGLSAGTVFRYHNLTGEADRRRVWDLYLADYSAHHISPYDPAQLDPFTVQWPKDDAWSGGVRDREVQHAGQSALKIEDRSETGGGGAGYGQTIPIPAGGLRLRLWYRTGAAGHPFIVTFNHHDADGKWMSGRNNDLRVEGSGEWQEFDRTVTRFPNGAKGVRLTLWPCLYSLEGKTTGTVWYDDVTLTDAGTGKTLVSADFEPLSPEALRPTIDWSRWDQAMARAIDHYRFNSFRLPIQGLGGGTFHARSEPTLLGYPEDSPEYRAAMAAYLKEVESHLRHKGWLDEAFVYWFDEPDPKDYEFVSNGFRKLKEYAPGLRRMLTEQPEPGLFGGPTIWCPVSSSYDADRAAARMAAGEEFWWYVCTGPKAPYCTLFIDHPATELRVWLWQTWQRNIKGILVWATNYWTSPAAYPDKDHPQNPYEDPMGWVSGYDTPAGTRRSWGNGDGRFVYPPEEAADGHPAQPVIAGPVDSIRFEMLRDGIEDYEYLVMLKRLLAERGQTLPADRRAKLEALLTVPPDITTDAVTFTKDPRPVLSRRAAVAAALETLTPQN